MANQQQPYWHANRETMHLCIISGAGNVLFAWPLPGVCSKYTGDTQRQVIRDEAAKMQREHVMDFNRATYAWQIAQALTPTDKQYVKYHKLWLASCAKHGERDAASRALQRELIRRGEHLTAAGNEAVQAVNRANAKVFA